MDFEKLVTKFFEQFTDLSGRSNRAEFWSFVAFVVVVFGTICVVAEDLTFSPAIASILTSLASIRRLHDTGRSGRWWFVSLVPVVGGLVFLYWLVSPSIKLRETQFEYNPYTIIKEPDASRLYPRGRLRLIDISTSLYPLILINIAKYFLVVICGVAGVYMLMVVIGLHSDVASVSDARFQLVIGILFVLFSFVGWKNIGNIGFSGSKSVWLIFAILLLTGVLGLCAVAWDRISENTAQAQQMRVEAWGGMILTALSLTGLMGLIWMESVRVEDIWRKPEEIIAFRNEYYSHSHGKISVEAKDPVVGVFYLAGAFILFVVAYKINALALGSRSEYANAIANYTFLFFIPIFTMIIYARQKFQPSLKKLLAMDRRPPTILLRSFADEVKQVRADPLGVSIFDYSLEDRLASYFIYTGPFVAVGSPTDHSPKLGAVRANLADDEWQAHIKKWMDSAETIVLMLGVSYWLNWELEQVIARRYWHKLIIIFPEETQRYLRENSQDRAKERRDYFLAAMRGTRWASALNELQSVDARRIRGIVLHTEGDVTAIVSSLRTRDAYHAGAILAHYILLKSRKAVEQPDYSILGKTPARAQPSATLPPRKAVSTLGWFEELGSGRRIALDKPGMNIGRHDENDIQLHAPTVHRRHAAVQLSPKRDLTITDLSGSNGNGIFVNSVRVQSAALRDGDVVQLGDIRLKFHAA
ncbi:MULTISPECIES: FHA domain-containing protein [Rhodomicrobium]|uniref:FHA domain-containing protein n=1 Tax=Rhodomicrobium TaxID=1068 RepID=UPI000B4BBA3C|nr:MULTISPECIES: FHA domain-containing protein [Rhodomicrobium]